MPETSTISLALQGGGAHGAFTWGVLDALLEHGNFRFDGVSGTSAGAMNAVVVQGDAVGTTMYYGKGAGSEPTASAVIADLVDIARQIDAPEASRVPALGFRADQLSNLPILPIDEVITAFYLRLRVADQTGVLAKITSILAEQGISIDAVIQREADEVSGEDGNQTDLMILTHDTKEGAMNKALVGMQALPTVLAPIVKLRKEELA